MGVIKANAILAKGLSDLPISVTFIGLNQSELTLFRSIYIVPSSRLDLPLTEDGPNIGICDISVCLYPRELVLSIDVNFKRSVRDHRYDVETHQEAHE